jgi:hypothetical protein
MTYLVHIIAGTLGLLTGYVALYAAKGGTLHRKSGMLFVYTTIRASGACRARGDVLYWLWRVRFRRSLRGLVVVRAPEALLRGS